MASVRSVPRVILLPALLCLLMQPVTAAPPADGDRPADPAVAPPENSQPIQGVIQDRDGKPLASVQVLLAPPRSAVSVTNGKIEERSLRMLSHVLTGDDGAFSFPPQTDPCTIVAISDAGYVEVSSGDLAEQPQITLQPWARIEGVARIGSQPAAGAEIYALPILDKGTAVSIRSNATTDAEGRFVLERVRPGLTQVHRIVRVAPTRQTPVNPRHLEAIAGETVNVQLGGAGRPVIGRIALPDGLSVADLTRYGNVGRRVQFPKFEAPAELDDMTPQERYAWAEQWLASPEGREFSQKQRAATREMRNYPLVVQPDGAFRLDDVEPGTYRLHITFSKLGANGQSSGEALATAEAEFTVDPISDDLRNEPLELPVIQAVRLVNLNAGDEAPAFTARTLDGSTEVRLEDLRGKYVLLDFWATWCVPCREETPALKAVYEKFGKDERFVMVGLSLDDKPAAPLKYTQANGMNWQQWFLGNWANTPVPDSFGVRGIPSIWLIGPDGKVVAKDLRGARIEQAVAEALKQQ